MPSTILDVPTLYDDPRHFDALFALWRQANAESLDVTFRFSSCGFLKQNAVAFLGGLARLVEHHGGRVSFDWDSLQDRVRVNLAQQGFLAAFGCPGGPWLGNSIPYREDQAMDKSGLMDYVRAFFQHQHLRADHALAGAFSQARQPSQTAWGGG